MAISNNFSFGTNGTVFHRSEVKILGLIPDPILSWDAHHMSNVAKKCNKIFVSLCKFRHYFTRAVLKNVIAAYMFPHIAYWLCVCGRHLKVRYTRFRNNERCRKYCYWRKMYEHITPALHSLSQDRGPGGASRLVTKVYEALMMGGWSSSP